MRFSLFCGIASHPRENATNPSGPDLEDLALSAGQSPSRVIKGGSYLRASNYCSRYRPAARQPQEIDLGAAHLRFRRFSIEQMGRDPRAESTIPLAWLATAQERRLGLSFPRYVSYNPFRVLHRRIMRGGVCSGACFALGTQAFVARSMAYGCGFGHDLRDGARCRL